MRTIRDVLRDTIAGSGKSLRLLAEAAGVDRTTLVRFVNGRGLSLNAAEALAGYFGLELAPAPKPREKKSAEVRRTLQRLRTALDAPDAALEGSNGHV
jgi:hypothetical protein